MNFEYLNKMIEYIEENLTEDIEYKNLAKIVGISVNSLQRIFVFITGITISEYIKNRRLSKAFEDIKNSNMKIIDIASKYKYNSNISFNRSFKKAFQMTPTQCRQEDVQYKQFPIINFKNEDRYNQLNYEIKYLSEKEIYFYKTENNKPIDSLYKIRELYNYLKENGIHEKLKEEEQYAISYFKNGLKNYLVGSETKYTSKEKIKIPSGFYAVFEVGTREQKDIVDLNKKIYSQWAKSTNISIDKNYSVEYYVGNNCYLCKPILN